MPQDDDIGMIRLQHFGRILERFAFRQAGSRRGNVDDTKKEWLYKIVALIMKKLNKLSKQTKQIARDISISDADAYIMELKANLYIKCSKLIKISKSEGGSCYKWERK